jgi:cytochrome P450
MKGADRHSSLAYLELFCAIAYLFARFDMVLHETDETSMEWVDRISARNHSDVQIKVLTDLWAEIEE